MSTKEPLLYEYGPSQPIRSSDYALNAEISPCLHFQSKSNFESF